MSASVPCFAVVLRCRAAFSVLFSIIFLGINTYPSFEWASRLKECKANKQTNQSINQSIDRPINLLRCLPLPPQKKKLPSPPDITHTSPICLMQLSSASYILEVTATFSLTHSSTFRLFSRDSWRAASSMRVSRCSGRVACGKRARPQYGRLSNLCPRGNATRRCGKRLLPLLAAVALAA